MINTNRPESRESAIADLATMMLESDDYLMLFDNIAPLLDDYTLIDLAAALELCPMHHCDYRICADDDDLSCLDYRS